MNNRTAVTMVGMDLGFVKTGVTRFRVTAKADYLVEARTLVSERTDQGSQVRQDLYALNSLLEQLDAMLLEWQPDVIYAEIPPGGAQGARAMRCMSLVTGMLTSFLRCNAHVKYELYDPATVELVVGAMPTKDERKRLRLTKGAAQAWKKQRIKETVMMTWPKFSGWPERKELAEDAYDSAAAFLCGKRYGDTYAALVAGLHKT